MVHSQTTNFRNSAAQFFLGSIALALVTLAFFRIHVDLASTARNPLMYIMVDATGTVLSMNAFGAIGIPAENAERLFNAFFTTKSSGMGMRLSIRRSIVEAHGGRLSTSGNVGPGATFQFVLPLHQEDTSGPGVPNRRGPPGAP